VSLSGWQDRGVLSLVTLGGVLLVATLTARAQTPQTPPVFRSSADVVSVDVSVRNGTRVVTGLQAKDFDVSDNGVRQDLGEVSYGKLPIDVTIALDVSYSVTGALLDRLRRAVVQLTADLGRDDRLKLMTFNMRVSRVVDFTSDASAVERAIQATSAGGGTSILDTLSVALVSADHPDRRQLVVLFTDGGDSLSATEPQTLLDVGRRTNATMTAVLPAALFGQTVLLVGDNVGPGRAGQPMGSVARDLPVVTKPSPVLQQLGQLYTKLAADTGGLVIQLASPNEDLTATFRRALDEFRSSYVLYFTPRGVDRGGFHTLQVAVPQDSGVTVRARRGYWGG
jgi:VWFA-related protein